MKYFTPQLFMALQSCESPAEFRAVNATWELAAGQYGTQLQEITARLEGALRRFIRHGSLHDALVLDIGTGEGKLTLVVREELAPRLLSLTYSLVEAPVIDRNALPERHRTPRALWLYDELEVDQEMLFNPKLRMQEKATAVPPSGESQEEWKPIFRHAILLSNGWEIRLRFHKLAAMRTTSLFRTGDVQPGADSLSCSA